MAIVAAVNILLAREDINMDEKFFDCCSTLQFFQQLSLRADDHWQHSFSSTLTLPSFARSCTRGLGKEEDSIGLSVGIR